MHDIFILSLREVIGSKSSGRLSTKIKIMEFENPYPLSYKYYILQKKYINI